jgi:hypothetical protein
MSALLRQAWWAPIAGLLALIMVALGVVFGLTGEDLETKVVSALLLFAGATFLAFGLLLRPDHLVTGNVLLLIGCVLAAFWFWTLVLPLLALILAAGVVTSGWRSENVAPAA